MARYIDADVLIKKIYPMGIGDGKYTINAKAVKFAIDNTPTADVAPKSEVAREIFAEIEEVFRLHTEGGYYLNGAWFPERLDLYTGDAIAELKKKYDVTDINVGDKFFTAEQVRTMTREEVSKNYSAIMKSMKKWGEQK